MNDYAPRGFYIRTLLPLRHRRKGVPHLSYASLRERRKGAATALTWPPGLGMGRPRFSKRPPFAKGEDLGTGGRVVKGSRL